MKDKQKQTHPSKLIQDALIHTALLEVDTRCLYDFTDNLLVDGTNSLVRHPLCMLDSRVIKFESQLNSRCNVARMCLKMAQDCACKGMYSYVVFAMRS